ncbi:MAG: hypothetical protein AVDCRST_MAG31-1668 [uncultured Sphingomonas sp.]|uniref:Uncharacterized protein n=1 Tax=uncultured Sphingomonas sp. TaxID=158754 RepID=A0A6J4TG47_9SPHN|nr:MAG: hypothetical protein AVDCRST_MAG31-1668 [uncultured Sphingomonas sp.]
MAVAKSNYKAMNIPLGAPRVDVRTYAETTCLLCQLQSSTTCLKQAMSRMGGPR